jgi:hypothetical protein
MKPLPFLMWHLLALALAAAACDGIHDPSAPGNLVPKTVDEDPTLPSLERAGTRHLCPPALPRSVGAARVAAQLMTGAIMSTGDVAAVAVRSPLPSAGEG